MQENYISANPVIWSLLFQPMQAVLLPWPFTQFQGKLSDSWQVLPAAIGLVMADTAMKASAVHITRYMTPSIGTSHSNEVILAISGDASAVKEAVLQARQIGLELLIGNGKLSGNSGRTVFITIPPIYYCRQMP